MSDKKKVIKKEDLQSRIISEVVGLLTDQRDDWVMGEVTHSATSGDNFNIYLDENLMVRKDSIGTRVDKVRTIVSNKGVPLKYRGIDVNGYDWNDEKLNDLSVAVKEISDDYFQRKINEAMELKPVTEYGGPMKDKDGNIIDIDQETGKINIVKQEDDEKEIEQESEQGR